MILSSGLRTGKFVGGDTGRRVFRQSDIGRLLGQWSTMDAFIWQGFALLKDLCFQNIYLRLHTWKFRFRWINMRFLSVLSGSYNPQPQSISPMLGIHISREGNYLPGRDDSWRVIWSTFGISFDSHFSDANCFLICEQGLYQEWI